MTTPILLRGGLVADGIGRTTRPADLLTDGRSVVSVEDREAPADVRGAAPGPPPDGCEVIDLAPGSVICPGFIDAHAHAEGPLLATGRVDGALAQGVTTLVVGQDGESWIGATADTARYLNQYFAPVNGALEPARDLSLAAYRDAVAGRLAQNVAVLASQGTIRHNVAALRPGALGPGERTAARRQVEEALAEGAVGLSSGLDYLPSRFGDIDEIADMARPLAAAGRPYVSHLRGYGPDVRRAWTSWPPSGAAQPSGCTPVTCGAGQPTSRRPSDRRRPLASASPSTCIPIAGPARSWPCCCSRPSCRRAARRRRSPRWPIRGSARRCWPGRSSPTTSCRTSTWAACPPASGSSPGCRSPRRPGAAPPAGEWVLDLLASAGLNVGGHLYRPALTEDDLAWLVTDGRHCAGSDGIYQGQHPHPRGYSTFALLFGRYLAQHGADAGYQQMARHLAVNAADAFGLSDRGRLAPGQAADICVIGPGGLTAQASYEHPRRPATGVSLVIVNGVVTWREGRPGTVPPAEWSVSAGPVVPRGNSRAAGHGRAAPPRRRKSPRRGSVRAADRFAPRIGSRRGSVRAADRFAPRIGSRRGSVRAVGRDRPSGALAQACRWKSGPMSSARGATWARGALNGPWSHSITATRSRWSPVVELDPSAPRQGTAPTVELLASKYGMTAAQADDAQRQMEQRAAQDGLEFRMGGLRSGNTRDAHRLLQLAKDHGLQAELAERLHRAYFTEQASIFDHASLTGLAVEAGLDRDDVTRVLASKEYGDAVDTDEAMARALGTNGVPLFVIDRRYGISGAQSPEVIAEVLDRAWAEAGTA